MKRIASILLLFAMLGLATGTLQYFHELQHDAEDAREDALAKAQGIPTETHHHDETNCQVCAQIHMAIIVYAWAPVLLLFGLFFGWLFLAEPVVVFELLPSRQMCRGPPTRFAL